MSVFHEIPIEKKERYKELKAKKSRLEARKIDFEDVDEYKQLKDEMYFDISTLKKGYRNLEEFKQHKSYQYALSVRNGEIPVGKYVKKVTEQFLDDMERSETDDTFEFVFDYRLAGKIDTMTGLMKAPSGIVAGTPINEMLAPFQWFFIMVSMGWKHKDDIEKRRYEKNVLDSELFAFNRDVTDGMSR